MLDWSAILRDLAHSIEHRLDRGIQTSEDTVRYYFFPQLVDAGISPEQMILERSHPYPALQNKEIDLTVVWPDGFWYIEAKYHRPIPSGRNRTRTQIRGQVISDFCKLALSDAQCSYLLYLADPKMAAHWTNAMSQPSGRADGVILLTPQWLEAQPKTMQDEVQKCVGAIPASVIVTAEVIASSETSRISARLYEVTSIPAA